MEKGDVVSALLESPLYLDIPLKERQVMVEYILCQRCGEVVINNGEGESCESGENPCSCSS